MQARLRLQWDQTRQCMEMSVRKQGSTRIGNKQMKDGWTLAEELIFDTKLFICMGGGTHHTIMNVGITAQ
jgi:hypothetical protein